MKFIRQALLPVLMSCATSAGNVRTMEELLNQVGYAHYVVCFCRAPILLHNHDWFVLIPRTAKRLPFISFITCYSDPGNSRLWGRAKEWREWARKQSLGGLGLPPRPFLFPTKIFPLFFFKGADVNATTDYDGRTPLHIACVEGNTEACEFLLAKGAITQVRDRFKCSPLDDAIKFRHKEIVKTLRKAGAQLMKSSMETAVELCRLAAKNRVDDLLVWQLAGADFNASDYDKRTPLHVVSSEKKCRQ